MAGKLISTSLKRLQQSLSAASNIPTDIKFLFKKENDGVTAVQEIKAHKLILALVSDVFEKAFYGGFQDDGSIEIKDATKESFEAMINFIYTKETDLSIYDFEMLCSIYCLSDKYNIDPLKEETLEAFKSKDISADNVLNVGVLADQHSAHEELTETLYESATKSLRKMFDGQLTKAADFCAKIDADTSPSLCRSAVKMMARLKTISPAGCSNCQASPCLGGVRITRTNLVPGAMVLSLGGIYKILGLHPNEANKYIVLKKDGQIAFITFQDEHQLFGQVFYCLDK